MARELPRGNSVRLRCLPEVVLVEVIDSRGGTVTWLSQQVQMRQLSGIHRLYRGSLCVTDLGAAPVVGHDARGFRQHHA